MYILCVCVCSCVCVFSAFFCFSLVYCLSIYLCSNKNDFLNPIKNFYLFFSFSFFDCFFYFLLFPCVFFLFHILIFLLSPFYRKKTRTFFLLFHLSFFLFFFLGYVLTFQQEGKNPLFPPSYT